MTGLQLAQACDELRRSLDIALKAPPPLVIDTLLRPTQDLHTGNMAGVRALIGPPLCSLPPDQTFALLTNLPPLPATYAVTQLAMLQVMQVR
jgi:hypothetical protein